MPQSYWAPMAHNDAVKAKGGVAPPGMQNARDAS
jgi:hypothetical protein